MDASNNLLSVRATAVTTAADHQARPTRTGPSRTRYPSRTQWEAAATVAVAAVEVANNDYHREMAGAGPQKLAAEAAALT
jgi:hypothetical protein